MGLLSSVGINRRATPTPRMRNFQSCKIPGNRTAALAKKYFEDPSGFPINFLNASAGPSPRTFPLISRLTESTFVAPRDLDPEPGRETPRTPPPPFKMQGNGPGIPEENSPSPQGPGTKELEAEGRTEENSCRNK